MGHKSSYYVQFFIELWLIPFVGDKCKHFVWHISLIICNAIKIDYFFMALVKNKVILCRNCWYGVGAELQVNPHSPIKWTVV